MYRTLIATETLAEHLDGSWAIVDCRDDLRDEQWGVEQYRAAHIPGAVYASLSHDLSATPTASGGRHPLPSLEALEATCGRLGIGPGVQVVAYDTETGMFASRLWWMLRYLGHDAVAVLDGGWSKWMNEGRPSQAGEGTRPAASFVARPRPHMRVDAEDVERRLGDPARLLVDARAPERYEGRVEPLDRAAGHIPGAVNHPYRSTLTEDGTMQPVERLRAGFRRSMGDRSADQVVMYCGSGVSACLSLLAMEHAGLQGATLYPESWSGWSNEGTRPVKTGPLP
ncbi:MAG: sulfurtransferase [Acidobacteria bacterium]|nr:sulfurtransferase [Acidobacteriota bacterium]